MSNMASVRGSESEMLKVGNLGDLGAKFGTQVVEPGLSSGNARGLDRDNDNDSQRQKKKSYERHTDSQVKGLETFFKKCTRPNIRQRKRLGQALGLEELQVKFWFQNKRTRMKVQHERRDIVSLKAENKRLRKENVWYKHVLGTICPNFNGPPTISETSSEEQHPNELDEALDVASKHVEEPLDADDPYLPSPLSFLPLDQFPAQPSCVGQTNGETSLTPTTLFEEGDMRYYDWSFLDDDLTIVANPADVDKAPWNP